MATLSHDNIHAHTPYQCFYLCPFDINALQGKDILAEVSSVTKLAKNIKKNSITTFVIDRGCFLWIL
jgi:hypothetical protein